MGKKFSEYLLENGKWTPFVQFYTNKRKYIFGAGHQAQLVLSMLNSYFESDVNGIIVSEKNAINLLAAQLYELPIFQTDEVPNKEDCAVLLAVSCKSNQSIAETLHTAGYHHICYVDDWELANEEMLSLYHQYLDMYHNDLFVRKQSFEQREKDNLQIEAEYSDCIMTFSAINNSEEEHCLEVLEQARQSSKQIFVYYGNCQFNAIRYYLIQNEWFRQHYFVFDLPKIYDMHQLCKKKEFLQKLWKETDLFLYQEVADIGGKYGDNLRTDYILTQLDEQCQKIKICNSYFDGYFAPQIFGEDVAEKIYKHKIVGHHKFAGREDYIIYEYIKTKDISKTIYNLLSEDYFSKEEVQHHVADAFKRLKEREETCDIIISDYIEKHLSDEILFYCMNHPSEFIVKELTRRILGKCGCLAKEIIIHETLGRNLDSWRQICYPSIMKNIGVKSGLRGYDEKYWYNVDYTHFIYDMSLPEYMENYIEHMNANHELDQIQFCDLQKVMVKNSDV